jgi:hypothetical protein
MGQLKDYPTTLVELKITQSIVSSKLVSMDQSTIETMVNNIIQNVKNVLGDSFDKIDCLLFRIDTLKGGHFTYDYIQHRFVLIGNGFENKLPLLKEKLKSYVQSKMGDKFSLIVHEEQEPNEIYSYVNSQVENTTHKETFISEKMLNFYHPDLYSISEKGWQILYLKGL